MMLFDSTDNFRKYEQDTGWREYYVFTKINGWKHRSHVLDTETSKPVEVEQPLHRVYESPKLDDDYATPSWHKRQLEKSPERIQLKKELKRLKKKPVTVTKL